CKRMRGLELERESNEPSATKWRVVAVANMPRLKDRSQLHAKSLSAERARSAARRAARTVLRTGRDGRVRPLQRVVSKPASGLNRRSDVERRPKRLVDRGVRRKCRGQIGFEENEIRT